MSTDPGVRRTVLRGLALNRTPGYHFTGHFLSVSHDHVAIETARTSMKVGPHCAEANGSINYGALSVFAVFRWRRTCARVTIWLRGWRR